MSKSLSYLKELFKSHTEGEADTVKSMAAGMKSRPVATLAQRAIDRGRAIEEKSKNMDPGAERKETMQQGGRIRRFGERLQTNRNLQLAFDKTRDSDETLEELLDTFPETKRKSLINAWMGGTDGATSAAELLDNYLGKPPKGQDRVFVASAQAVADRAMQADDAKVKAPGEFINDSSIVPVGSAEQNAGVVAGDQSSDNTDQSGDNGDQAK